MQDAGRHWQRGLDAGRWLAELGGLWLYLQAVGVHPWWQFGCFLAGLSAFTLWSRYTRPRVWPQALLLLMQIAYVMAMPVIILQAWGRMVFVAGLLLPVTLVIAAVYFAARSRAADSRRAIGE